MVHTFPNNAVLILIAMLMSWVPPANATDMINPLITYRCDSDADVLTITNSLLKGDKGANFEYSSEHGTYSPWDMVEVARETDTTRIIKSNKIANTCNLASGEYKVILEPQIFSLNLDGQCGNSISAAVTIMFDGMELLERTAFEDYCHGNAPIITRITVLGKTGEYKIKRIAKYKFY